MYRETSHCCAVLCCVCARSHPLAIGRARAVSVAVSVAAAPVPRRGRSRGVVRRDLGSFVRGDIGECRSE